MPVQQDEPEVAATPCLLSKRNLKRRKSMGLKGVHHCKSVGTQTEDGNGGSGAESSPIELAMAQAKAIAATGANAGKNALLERLLPGEGEKKKGRRKSHLKASLKGSIRAKKRRLSISMDTK